MPMGEYSSFADCVSKNKDKSDPDAYCGKIYHETHKGKDQGGVGMGVYPSKRGVKIELKSGDDVPEGSFKAVFSRFDVIDHDGDVTFKDAFTRGQRVPIAGVGHNWNIPTIGYGVIDFDSEKAWVDGQFNLKMQSAREHYESVKFAHENGVNQEFSYAYDVKQKARHDEMVNYPTAKRGLKGLDVKEISPVLLGAGINTGLMAVKGVKVSGSGKWPSEEWQVCPVCGDPLSAHGLGVLAIHRELYGSVYTLKAKAAALSDEQRREMIQSAIREGNKSDRIDGYIVATFTDHVIVHDYEDEGYLKIPYTIDGDEVSLGDSIQVEQVWMEKSADLAALKYADHAERVLAALSAYSDRSKSLADLRTKVGRQLSAANRQRISDIVSGARAAVGDLEKLLEEATPPNGDEKARSRARLALNRALLGEATLRYDLH